MPMPEVRPITDLQRNMKAISAIVEETHEPVYLTRNGKSALVVMDAETFDQEMALQNEVRERELRINKSIQRGMEDYAAGRVTPLAQAIEQSSAARKQLF